MRPLFSDWIIKKLQRKYFAVHGGVPNSMEPLCESRCQVLEDGVVLHNEVRFSEKYPNSFADIYYTNQDMNTRRPTIIYLHGGGFFMGGRIGGDPMAVSSDAIGKQNCMLAKQGFNVVSMDYCLAPEFRYPNQPKQINDGLNFFREHAQQFHLDMDNIILFGGSAGAVLSAMQGVVSSNSEYATMLGIESPFPVSSIRGICVDGAPLVMDWMNTATRMMFKTWMGKSSKNGSCGKQIELCRWVNEENPAVFLTAGNDGCFPEHVQELGKALRNQSVYVEEYYIDPTISKQGHGYLGNYESDPCAKEGMDRIITFMKRVTSDI